MRKLLFLLPLLFVACTGLERSEQDRIKRVNTVKEKIYRLDKERFTQQVTPKPVTRAPYAWEKKRGSFHPRITKEYFRCKGSKENPATKYLNHTYYDCGGFDAHSLPIINDQEFIYPILINLLNHVQEVSEKKVVITCGHRCPDHNKYAEPKRATSLHMIGAEVDFYVEGLEDHPEKVAELIQSYYDEGEPDYKTFRRYDRQTDTKIHPWYNKEIFIKIYTSGEGRDFDNDHSHPYLTLQVRYSRDDKKPVTYNWHRANCSFYRW
ncbi:MAG: hypothetical protein P0S94_04885 [Simkaniaceae bacterium]|nr:hypothetical protein [Simkaniaceae bacterium]